MTRARPRAAEKGERVRFRPRALRFLSAGNREENQVPDPRRSGKHRHLAEECLYVLEGSDRPAEKAAITSAPVFESGSAEPAASS